MPTRSEIIVGRDTELKIIDEGLSAASAGSGRTIVLSGEAGIGKSRLATVAADRAATAGLLVLRGRASAIGQSVPFRPLTEALLSLLRTDAAVDVTGLGPYQPVLGQLVPDWNPASTVRGDMSPVILAEGVLRLIGLAGQDRGCLMVLDDLQDADEDSLAVVEYLIDNLAQLPAMLLCTVRSGPGAALDLAGSAARRGACALVELGRLGHDEVRHLAASWLDTEAAAVPDAVADRLWKDSAGNPFVAEELLDGMVRTGLVVRAGDTWRATGELHTIVPRTLVHTLANRMDLLDAEDRHLLLVAAVVGRRFPLEVVRTVTGMDDRDLPGRLRGAVAAQLVEPDDQQPDWYQFRHPLTAEALLSLLAPGARAGIAGRVADAVEASYPGLPGEWCQLVASLRLDAGDLATAGRLLAECGRRTLALGAASSAVALLDRARDLLAEHGDASVRADVLESLLYALAEAGQVQRALAHAGALEEFGGAGLNPTRRAALHTRIAWAAAIADCTDDGWSQVAAARAVLGPSAPAELTVPIDVAAARLTVAVPGHDRVERAEELARRAATAAEAVPLPMAACQAWQLLAVLTRGRDLDEATACLERARQLAITHDLPIREIHALVGLGADDALRYGTIDRLEQARQRALRAGAVTAFCRAEARIAMYSALRGDFATGAALTDRVLATVSRLKLAEITRYTLLVRAVLAAHQGRRRQMDSALAELGGLTGDPGHLTSMKYGLARAFCALLEEDRSRASAELALAEEADGQCAAIFHLGGRHGLQMLLRALDGDLDRDGYRELVSASAAQLPFNRQFVMLADAVLLGRSKHRTRAAEAVDRARQIGARYPVASALGLRLVAEDALQYDWGVPVDWLRSAEEYFHGCGVTAVAAACRSLLRRSGNRLIQRRRGHELIPGRLRSAGVTLREYEVLTLVARHHGNRTIATRLHISPRTVEKHIASLLSKTGLPDRVSLGDYALTLLAVSLG